MGKGGWQNLPIEFSEFKIVISLITLTSKLKGVCILSTIGLCRRLSSAKEMLNTPSKCL